MNIQIVSFRDRVIELPIEASELNNSNMFLWKQIQKLLLR